MVEAERRRRRPAISCALCRRRKIRCNRESPCSNCVRSKSEPCVYENPPPPPRQAVTQDRGIQPAHIQSSPSNCTTIAFEGGSFASIISSAPSNTSTSVGPGSTTASSPVNPPSLGDFESMKRRIQELERQLNQTAGNAKYPPNYIPENVSIETSDSGLTGTFHHIRRQGQVVSNVMHKTRLFGQSHWFNGVTLFQDMFELLQPYVHDPTSKATAGVKKCKSLARAVKLERASVWPTSPTTELPSRDIADALVECYLRSSESIHRVLHIPSFKRDYEAMWASETDRDMAFVIQVKLVLAIGAVTYDKLFSLRSAAIKWVYEAQTWLSAPVFKSRLVLQAMQTHVLHLIARETVGVGEDLVWASAGELLRKATFMGLHVDPSRLPARSTVACEMRRRIWNTIIEMNLMSSMSAGGSPFLSLDDFNTEPPSNLDDDQLLSEDPAVKPDNEFTQTSIAIALRKTFPIRLEIAKFLNSLNSTTCYNETLRLDKELRSIYKDVSKLMRGYGSMGEEDTSQPPYALQVVDFVIRRCIISLHATFFKSSIQEAAYAFSRKVVIDTSLKIWAMVYPSSVIACPQPGIQKHKETILSRLTSCSCLYYRIVSMQCFFFIATEVTVQLKEDEGFGVSSVRPDLLAMVDELRLWSWECIEAGETNMKGYLFASLVGQQIDALRKGADRQELAKVMIKAVEDSVDRCLAAYEARTGKLTDKTPGVVADVDTPAWFSQDWDLMMTDSDFTIGDWDPNGWVINDASMTEFSMW